MSAVIESWGRKKRWDSEVRRRRREESRSRMTCLYVDLDVGQPEREKVIDD